MNRRIVLATLVALTPALSGLPATAQGAEHKKGGGASFIQLDALSATIMRADGRRGVMTVDVGIDVPDAALHARAAQSTPLLLDAFSEVVRTYAAGLSPMAPPNADYLSLRLQQATDRVLGRSGARLLLGNILIG
ncbi:MAG TPA: Tat pathway signal protein [Caulobacteraceae bacterium]|nr:Tat pathway signal protein [Caulobacteraceae bacterium]